MKLPIGKIKEFFRNIFAPIVLEARTAHTWTSHKTTKKYYMNGKEVTDPLIQKGMDATLNKAMDKLDRAMDKLDRKMRDLDKFFDKF